MRCPICGIELGLPDDRIYVDTSTGEPVACSVCYDYGDDDVRPMYPETFWELWRT